MLMRFMIGGGLAHPQWIVSPQGFGGGVASSKRSIINNLFKIKHWKIICSEHHLIENENATWFIDPPYQFGGHKYVHGNKKINFNQLSEWCKERIGQVIVCENTKATWMDFKPIKKQHGSTFSTTEAIWTNTPTVYGNTQTQLELKTA